MSEESSWSPSDKPFPHWVVFEHGAPKRLTEIRVPASPKKVEVSFSLDGKTWTEPVRPKQIGATIHGMTSYALPETVCRFVKISEVPSIWSWLRAFVLWILSRPSSRPSETEKTT